MLLKISIIVAGILLLFSCTNSKPTSISKELSATDKRCRDSIENILQQRYYHCFETYKAVEYSEAKKEKGHFDTALVAQQISKLEYLIKNQLHTNTTQEQNVIENQITMLQDSLQQLRKLSYYHVIHTYSINERGCNDTIRLEVAFDTLFNPKYLVFL